MKTVARVKLGLFSEFEWRQYCFVLIEWLVFCVWCVCLHENDALILMSLLVHSYVLPSSEAREHKSYFFCMCVCVCVGTNNTTDTTLTIKGREIYLIYHLNNVLCQDDILPDQSLPLINHYRE